MTIEIVETDKSLIKDQIPELPKKKIKPRVTFSAIIAICSAVCSLIAIGVSIKSCTLSERVLDISNEEYLSSRSAIYKGVLNATNDKLILNSIDSNIQIQCAAIYLPPQLDETTWNISAPDFGFPLLVMRNCLEKFLDENVSKEEGYVKIIDHTSIPLIIASSYIAKGESYSDMSLYQLVYQGIVLDEVNKRPKITFKGLIFRERLPMNIAPQKFLSELWETAREKK